MDEAARATSLWRSLPTCTCLKRTVSEAQWIPFSGGEASGRARRERASQGVFGNELWALRNTPGGPEEESDLEGSITTR